MIYFLEQAVRLRGRREKLSEVKAEGASRRRFSGILILPPIESGKLVAPRSTAILLDWNIYKGLHP